MTKGDRPHVHQLLERVLAEAPHDPSAWLDEKGVLDWQIREEVLSLVRHHRAGGLRSDGPTAGDESVLDETLVPGALGPYRVIREVGRGGMGRVYLATDTRLGRHVALKALAPQRVGDPFRRERLHREARAAAALAHPGICTAYALEEIDGKLFIASEFVDGHTLREEIASGPPPRPDTLVRTAEQLADALAHAHGRGVVHRDLKPENVMRTREGSIKILDFGLARLDSSAQEPMVPVTLPGSVIGTPAYMAPEQLNGERADARADVFAFGVLISEYASGVHPFAADTPLAMVGRILHGTPDDIRVRRRDLPRPFLGVVERCLQKAPQRRFGSGVELCHALRDGQETLEPARGFTAWWRMHHLVLIAMYFVVCGVAWQLKEWQPGVTSALFLGVGTAATVAGVIRGHLLFTERVNRSALLTEHRRALLITLVADLLLAAALAFGGLAVVSSRPLAGVLAIALGVTVALARLVIEPATAEAALRE